MNYALINRVNPILLACSRC